MESAVTCHCKISCGLGLPSLLVRLMGGRKKRKMVDAHTQLEDDFLNSLNSKIWGEKVHNMPKTSVRVNAPPPPPERKVGRHSTQPKQEGMAFVGPFAPTIDELQACRASLKPVHRRLTSSASMPPQTPSPKMHRQSKSVSVPDNGSPMSVCVPDISQPEH